MDVDPVVGERVLAVDHEQHGEELPVAQTAGGVAHVERRLGLGDAHGGAQRQRRDHVRGVEGLAAGDDLGHPPVLDPQPGDRGVQPDLAAVFVDVVGHLLPHLAGAEAGVVELEISDLILLPSLPKNADLAAEKNDRPLIR